MTFVADPHKLDALINGPEGPVAKILAAAAIRVESQAKLNATGAQVVGAVNPAGRGPRVRTDRLRSSIGWNLGRDEIGLYAVVGTKVYYGRYLEQGWTTSSGSYWRYPFLKPALSVV